MIGRVDSLLDTSIRIMIERQVLVKCSNMSVAGVSSSIYYLLTYSSVSKTIAQLIQSVEEISPWYPREGHPENSLIDLIHGIDWGKHLDAYCVAVLIARMISDGVIIEVDQFKIKCCI